MNILEVKNIKKSFGKDEILKSVSIQVPEHSIYGFVGENGAGKTTTMNIILGLLQATSGEVIVDEKKVVYNNQSTNKNIGYLPDVPSFYSYYSAREYLFLVGQLTGIDKQELNKRVDELLELVNLKSGKRRIGKFSRGMKQRLGLAQALLNRPKLIICDEPTSALDPIGRKEVLELMQSLKHETTILFSSHILEDVEKISDQVAILHNGEIQCAGSLEEIKRSYPMDGFKLSFESNEEKAAFLQAFGQDSNIQEEQGALTLYTSDGQQTGLKVMAFLNNRGIVPKTFTRLEPTLESIFMEVTGA
ncbi:ABC transporter ATP-binding protein [Enterococcus sp. BWR-S5]|uniref:ABC transporter ATP-binding protein n=1 Tax=Enterococcus sp. BWR-S5 TaxID=2787714 RepID=UPI001921FA63|nr:ABC transporter ATP-binding protein [Enterococcus sp. BWR-S5]MBL1226432.1 ABC transporter ATP-binding protein [Enterococcus sp. BWR-S5]